MKPVLVTLDERLEHVGDSFNLNAHLDEDSYSLGEHGFSLPDGLDYELVVSNVGEGILVTGILRGTATGECDRCLEEASLDIAAEVDGYYLFELPPEDELADDESELDYFLVSPEHTIDLSEALNTALLMDTPFVVLCRPDCKGLCPHCGANLNEGECGCAEEHAEEALKDNPFAVLAGLDLPDGPEQGSTDDEEASSNEENG